MTDPLYLPEAEIAARILGKGNIAEWHGLAPIFESEGMPKIDPLVSRRYWPAVQAFLDARHRVATLRQSTPQTGRVQCPIPPPRELRPRQKPQATAPIATKMDHGGPIGSVVPISPPAGSHQKPFA